MIYEYMGNDYWRNRRHLFWYLAWLSVAKQSHSERDWQKVMVDNTPQKGSPLWMEAKKYCESISPNPCDECLRRVMRKHQDELDEIAYGYYEHE